MVFPGDVAPAAESSRTKFSQQAEKVSANFPDAKTRSAYFPTGGIFVSGLAGQQSRASRFPAASTFLFGTNRPKSPVYIQQPQRPTRQSPNAFFAASVFQTRKHEVHIFSASKAIVSGLAGQYLPLPILLQPPTRQLIPFRHQPANTSSRHSFHTGPHNP